jgi:hypothetical protein
MPVPTSRDWGIVAPLRFTTVQFNFKKADRDDHVQQYSGGMNNVCRFCHIVAGVYSRTMARDTPTFDRLRSDPRVQARLLLHK